MEARNVCFVFRASLLLLSVRLAMPNNMASDQHRTSESVRGSTTRSGWGALEISPNAFLSIVYKSTFRISVYKNQPQDPTATQYYYSPALIIDPSSASSSFNNFTKRYEMTFAVVMWDEEFEEFVRSKISERTKQTIPLSSVRILPIEEIRIDGLDHSDEHNIYNKWVSYVNQPATFVFRMNCLRNDSCQQATENLRQNLHSFVSDVVVYYSLQTQRSSRRMIQVKTQHLQSGTLYTTMKQQFPETEKVYMTADDLKRLTQEIANSVVSTEVTDEEFVSQDQTIGISVLLENLLQSQSVSSAAFTSQMWSSVFWMNDNSRPDKVTESLNDLYNKSDARQKDFMRNRFSSQSSNSQSDNADVSLLDSFFGASSGSTDSSSSQVVTNEERDKAVSLLTEAKAVSQWKGERFIPREMELRRINLAVFRASTVITSTQVRVAKSTSELSSRINLLPSSANAGDISQQRLEVYRLQQKLQTIETKLAESVPTGTIVMIFSATVPAGWLPCNGMKLVCASVHQDLCRVLQTDVTPNFQGRFPVGFGSHFATNVGGVGGEEKHTLTVEEMPHHTHHIWAHWGDPGNFPREWAIMHLPTKDANYKTATGGSGGNQPHNTLPPYLAVQFMIKV